MTPVYSHSRLSSFEKCPKQFHFRYVLKLPQLVEGIEAYTGKRVHEVLERLYEFADSGRVPSLQRVLDRYYASWDEQYDPERVRIVREGTPSSFYRELGARGLSNFYHRHYPFDAGETLGLEQHVLFDLDSSGQYRIQGIVDRIVRASDGVIEIQDYKTGQRVPSQKQLDEDRQLALYQIGVGELFGHDQPMRLVWHYVSRSQIRISTRTPDQLAELREKTISAIDRITAETEFAPHKMTLCSWCEYKSQCPAWTDSPPPLPARRRRRPREDAPAAPPSQPPTGQLSLL